MDAKEFHRQLDSFYEAGDIPGAYRFLHAQLDTAQLRGDAAMSLTVSNALIGHCRENCIFEELEGHYLEALRCLDVLELRGSLEEATTLLNAATGFCVMGRIEESEDLFRSAEALYLALQAEMAFRRGDYALAGERFEAIAEAWRRYGGAEQRRGVLLRNAQYSYEKAGDEAAAARIASLLTEVGK